MAIVQNVTNVSFSWPDHSGYLNLEEKICSWKNALLKNKALCVVLSFCLILLMWFFTGGGEL